MARLETPAPIRLALPPDSPRHPGVQAAPAWPCQHQRRLFPVLPGEGSSCLHLLMDCRAQIRAWGIQNLGGFSAGWVHPSCMGHPGSHGVGAPCRVSAPCPPPGRRDEDSDHPSPVVAKCCPATPGRTLQPSPHQASPAQVPQLQRAPAPTSPPTALLPPAREGLMFPGSVAAMRRLLAHLGGRGV